MNDDGKKIRIVTGENRFSPLGIWQANAGTEIAALVRDPERGCNLQNIPILQITMSPADPVGARQFVDSFGPAAGVTFISTVLQDFITGMFSDEDDEEWAGVHF